MDLFAQLLPQAEETAHHGKLQLVLQLFEECVDEIQT